MKMHGNTMLITGGGSGIGGGLAEAFHKLGNQVIIGGRREPVLRKMADAHPGMEYTVLDVSTAESIGAVVPKVLERFPEINVLINNAGVQRGIHFASEAGYDDKAAQEEIDTNIYGVMRMAGALTPHLKGKPDAVIVNVSSGLAFVPMARFPVYCATKAFVHSFTMSLRHQLKGDGISVIELAPPWVATNLGSLHDAPPVDRGGPISLDEFIAATMAELATESDELKIGGAKFLYAGGVSERQAETFAMVNR